MNLDYVDRYDYHKFIIPSLNRLPQRFRPHVIAQHRAIYTQPKPKKFDPYKAPKRLANVFLLDTVEAMKGGAYRLAASEGELRDFADAKAYACTRAVAKGGYKMAAMIAHMVNIEPPAIDDNMTEHGACARLSCSGWWRRAVRKTQGRHIEAAAINFGMVHKKSELYASEETRARRAEQNAKNRMMLEEVRVVNEHGDEYSLQELADLSVSNKAIRRAELMTRVNGFEKVAGATNTPANAKLARHHVWDMHTITCPSRMHRKKTDKHGNVYDNNKFDGSTPRQGQQFLSKVWARFRSAIARRGVHVYGFRVAEPQHDGTPHHHILLFQENRHRKLVQNLLHNYSRGIVKPKFRYGSKLGRYVQHGTGVCWLNMDGGEYGAKKHRHDVVQGDPSKGTAAGYLIKYICKNIDGYGVDVDLFGNDPKAAAARVDAWASCWGIRQFQQIGGPSVTAWRELRRLKPGDVAVHDPIEAAWEAADKGDWAAFVDAMGGPVVPRAEQPLKVFKIEDMNLETGEQPTNRYGEPAAAKIAGLEYNNVLFLTRHHKWSRKNASEQSQEKEWPQREMEVLRNNRKKPDVERTTEAKRFLNLGGELAAPWTSVNNCTEVNANEQGREVLRYSRQPEKAGRKREITRPGGRNGPRRTG